MKHCMKFIALMLLVAGFVSCTATKQAKEERWSEKMARS